MERLRNEKSCLGHKETVFGVSFSPCGKFLATASQESKVCVWKGNRLHVTLSDHDSNYECLRVAWSSLSWRSQKREIEDCDRQDDDLYLASGSADGRTKIWQPLKDTQCRCVIDLFDENKTDQAQVYVLQFVDVWKGLSDENLLGSGVLMSSEDNLLHLWTESSSPADLQMMPVSKVNGSLKLSKICTFNFESNDNVRAFGGQRNPSNITYIFDASYCHVNGILAVALSDGSIRCVNGSNGAYLSILEFPSEESCHISALTWDCTGKSLASSLSSGHIVLWDVEDEEKSSCSADESCNEVTERVIHITSTAVLEGGLCWRLLISHSLAFYHILKDMILIFRNDSDRIGHTSGRSIFGTKYLSVDNDDEKENCLISWGSDGRICAWDPQSQGHIFSPSSILLDRPEYPIYSVDITYLPTGSETDCGKVIRLAAGGGTDGGFIGLPVYTFDVSKDSS